MSNIEVYNRLCGLMWVVWEPSFKSGWEVYGWDLTRESAIKTTTQDNPQIKLRYDQFVACRRRQQSRKIPTIRNWLQSHAGMYIDRCTEKLVEKLPSMYGLLWTKKEDEYGWYWDVKPLPIFTKI